MRYNLFKKYNVQQLKNKIEALEQTVSKCKVSEQLLATALDYAPIGMVTLTSKGKFKTVNKAFSKITGYTEKELFTLNISQITHPDDKPIRYEAIEELSAGKATKANFEKRFIHKKGNCSLEEASDKLYGKIFNWASLYPNKPIVFSGVSNGARLAADVASRLKIEGEVSNKIKVNCIAGPFFGSKVIHPNCKPLVRRIWQFILSTPLGGSLSKEIIKELAWNSEKSKELISKIRIAAQLHGISFDFYASQADSLVLPFTSSLVSNVQNSKCYISDKEGHRSIINASSEQIIINLKQFMKF